MNEGAGLLDLHCASLFAVSTNLCKSSEYKKQQFKKVGTHPSKFVNCMITNAGQEFVTYGNLYMDIMVKLGFRMAAKYMRDVFWFCAHTCGLLVVDRDYVDFDFVGSY